MKRFLILGGIVLVIVFIVSFGIRNARTSSGPAYEARRASAHIKGAVLSIQMYEKEKHVLPENLEQTREYNPGVDNALSTGIIYTKTEGDFRYKLCAPYPLKTVREENTAAGAWSLSEGTLCLSAR